MDRREIWEHTIQAIEEHFTSGEFSEGEFRVVHNDTMGTITVIEDVAAFQLMDTTGSYCTGGTYEGEPILVHLPNREVVERMGGPYRG